MQYLSFIVLIISLLAIALSGLNLWMVIKIDKIRKHFFTGKQAASLEDFIINQNRRINEMARNSDFIEKQLLQIHDQQKLSVQKIGLTRYNPFNDDGGNLSFSMAILDHYNNGVVITSMHGREQNRIYAKPIKDNKSEFTLTQEEIDAINSAKNQKIEVNK